MHELSVTQHILDIILRHAEGAERITDVYLVIGELSSMVDDSVQFYWDMIAVGTPAEGAHLHFQRVAAAMVCRDCQHSFPLGDNFTCPECGSPSVTITGGDEFYVESITTEGTELDYNTV
jgi:hydrogenase nickel incorporation protein HypA/HybF